MLIEIHMIQNHSPSNLNRDDLGAPKSCTFGGVTRARISSQCLKRSIRKPANPDDVHNREAGILAVEMPAHIGTRTKSFPLLVEQELAKSSIPEQDRDQIVLAAQRLATGKEEKQSAERDESASGGEKTTKQLIHLGPGHAKAFVAKLVEIKALSPEDYKSFLRARTADSPIDDQGAQPKGSPEKGKKGKKGKNDDKVLDALRSIDRYDAVDIALFGRMTTSELFEDVEASVQVAHAISTHEAVTEVDYFTAVDDLGKSGGGAGHVDEAMFNSACFYKYFSLDFDSLYQNLSPRSSGAAEPPDRESFPYKLAAAALGHFLRAAALSNPSGKQNSFAAHNLPDAILVEVKERKLPISYANAFSVPVDPKSDGGPVGQSINHLVKYASDMAQGYGIASTRFWFSPGGRHPFSYEGSGKAGATQVPCASQLTSFEDFVSAVVKSATGSEWADIRDIGKSAPAED